MPMPFNFQDKHQTPNWKIKWQQSVLKVNPTSNQKSALLDKGYKQPNPLVLKTRLKNQK